MFSFTITGISVYPSKAYAGAQDGKFHLKCPKPAKWMLPNGKCINKGTKKRAGIAAYWNSQDTGGTGADASVEFLSSHGDVWKAWVSADIAASVEASL